MIAVRPVLVPVFKALTAPFLARNSANRTGSSGCCHRNWWCAPLVVAMGKCNEKNRRSRSARFRLL